MQTMKMHWRKCNFEYNQRGTNEKGLVPQQFPFLGFTAWGTPLHPLHPRTRRAVGVGRLGGLLWRTVLREASRRAFLTRSPWKLWPWSMCSQEAGLALSSSWLVNNLLPETKAFLQRKQKWLITSTKLSSDSYFLIGIFWNSQLESLRELHPTVRDRRRGNHRFSGPYWEEPTSKGSAGRHEQETFTMMF